MDARTSDETRNEQVIRTLYSLAEAKSKDTPKFVSMFTDDGDFYDVAAGKQYYGRDIGVTVDVYATAFPDMHREFYRWPHQSSRGRFFCPPKEWAEALWPNLFYWNELDKGGHFAAWEHPQLFVAELQVGFRSLRSSSG